MSDDVHVRLKEKTLQIAQLQHQLQVLQAQLEGTQRRAGETSTKIVALENLVAEKDSENHMLRTELGRTKGALDTMGKEIQGIRAEQTQQMAKAKPSGDEYSVKQKLSDALRKNELLKEDIKSLSEAASAVLKDEPGAREQLRDAIMLVGDPRFKILNIILEKRSVRVEELAASLQLDTTEALALVDELKAAGEIEVRDGSTVILREKYRAVKIPVEEWKTWDPADIFDSLEDIVGRTEGHESISKAIIAAVDILEQKIARGGALVFQMRKTADLWKKGDGNSEELQYTIREWKGRALSLG
jgi:chromosome segregation ATPase